MHTALYAGSFDPITNGHMSLNRRGLHLFDRIIVGVANQTSKPPLFTLEERCALVRDAIGKHGDAIEIVPFSGLTVDYAAKRGCCAILRGLRAVSDFEFEFQLALMNRRLNQTIETVFLMTDYKWLYISSTIIKGAVSNGASVEGLVPDNVLQALKQRLGSGRRTGFAPMPRKKGFAGQASVPGETHHG